MLKTKSSGWELYLLAGGKSQGEQCDACSKAWEVEGLYQTEASLNSSLEPQMRITIAAFAVLNIANLTCVLTLVYRKQEDRVKSFVRNTGRIQEQKNKRMAVLSQTEEMMVREEIFLESLASKLARKENAISVDSSEWVPRLKSFLKTFIKRPRLQTKGKYRVFRSVHYLDWQEKENGFSMHDICHKHHNLWHKHRYCKIISTQVKLNFVNVLSCHIKGTKNVAISKIWWCKRFHKYHVFGYQSCNYFSNGCTFHSWGKPSAIKKSRFCAHFPFPLSGCTHA